MKILSKEHNQDTMKEWFEEDIEEILSVERHRNFLMKALSRHSFKKNMRTPLQDNLIDTEILIHTLKAEMEHNYGLPYIALFKQFKSKVISKGGQARDSY